MKIFLEKYFKLKKIPQVDLNTYTTTTVLISNLFMLGYIIFVMFLALPLINSFKVEKFLLSLINLRLIKAKNYLNFSNFMVFAVFPE
jgi:hypothetical protein